MIVAAPLVMGVVDHWTIRRSPCRPIMIQSTLKESLRVSITGSNYSLDNMFQHKYLIYNRDCTLLTYAVQTKIKIDEQASFKDVC